jgi:hypothetical protein
LALTNARVGARDDANARHRRALVVTARLNIVVVRRRPSSVVECGKKSRHRAVARFFTFTPTAVATVTADIEIEIEIESINQIFSARVNARRVASPCRDPIRASSR